MRQYIVMAAVVGLLAAGGMSLMAQDTVNTNGTARVKFIEGMKERQEAKYAERMTRWQKKHDEFMAKFKEHLAKNSKMTDGEKAELTKFLDDQYSENKAFRQTQHDENMKFLDDLAGQGAGLSKDQIKQEIKDHFAKQKDENKAHRAEEKSERKAERAKIKADNQTTNAPAGN